MNVADTYLYYPLIRIPDETLIYSLLYKDRIKRIIPPAHSVGNEDWEEFDRPNRIIRQALGYDFIEEADFYESKRLISEPFFQLVKDSYKTRSPVKFEPLLGKTYKKRFQVTHRIILSGVVYFLYPEKIDPRIFELLESIGWLKEDKQTHRCEVEKELWHVYMTLLAANVSKAKGESISTNFALCEEILRNPVFQEYFGPLIPEHYSKNTKIEEVCINLLFNNCEVVDEQRVQAVPLHNLISLQQAAYIRSGLEDKRVAFCNLINNLINEVVSLQQTDNKAFIELLLKEIVESTIEFNSNLKARVSQELTSDKKSMQDYWFAGLSLCFPLVGVVLDPLFDAGSQLYYGVGAGSIAALISFLALQNYPKRPKPNVDDLAYSSRQKAYLYLNRLLEIRRSKLAQQVDN